MNPTASMQCYAARSNARQRFLATFWRPVAKISALPEKWFPSSHLILLDLEVTPAETRAKT
jgi:hypothetical protein